MLSTFQKKQVQQAERSYMEEVLVYMIQEIFRFGHFARKDIVLTLVPDSLTNKVMDAIGQGINIDIPGNGICFSIDVDKVIGITKIHQYREIIGMQELLDENNDREKSES